MKTTIIIILLAATVISAAPKNRTRRCFLTCGIQDRFRKRIKDRVSSVISPVIVGNSYSLSKLPKLPNILPAWSVRRGPYGGVCGCLGNLGGCYIDAANHPGPGFTCKCVKAEGWATGRNYGCVGLGYKLARHERNTGGTYDLKQCRSGNKSPWGALAYEGDCGGYIDAFGDYEWNKVRQDVTIKLFSPRRFHQVEDRPGSGEKQCGIWEQGEDISCRLDGEESIVRLPNGFNRNLPVKGVIHGFADDARFRSEAVAAYHKKFNGNVNVILFDWSPLAKVIDFEDTLDNYLYYRGARNVPIVGEYLGRCLAGISKATGLRGRDIHIAGHSLGGQMLGRLGRAYFWWVKHLTGGGEKLGRLTGLDPAGPAFVDGDTPADPRLHKERLKSDAAQFVDVIHTNAAKIGPILLNIENPFELRLGDYGPNGHYDFYVDGGDGQRGCNPDGVVAEVCKVGCSHDRAYHYFINSINDNCLIHEDSWDICMGEQARDSWTGTGYNLFVKSDIWYLLHRSNSISNDCKYTARYACKAFANVYTQFIDSRVCTRDYNYSPKCRL